jgi:hypothetical protein
LPGVAIAVAVIPPLSVVGYGLSTHQGSIAGGAFLLFVTNLVSIIISAAAVFRIIGFQPLREAEQGRWKLKYRLGISALVLILLSIPLFLTLRKAAIEVAIRSGVQRELNVAFQRNKASVSNVSFSQIQDGLLIQATLQTPRYYETDAIQSVQNTLRKKYGQGTKLLVDQILVTQGGLPAAPAARAQNPISGGVVKPAEQNAPFDFKASSLKILDFVQGDLDELLAGTGIQREAVPEIVIGSASPMVLRLQLVSPEPLSSQTISLLASQLTSKLGLPIQLHGQVELQGPAFQLTIAPAKPNLGLDADERIALGKAIKQAQEDNLRLQVTYASDRRAGGDNAIPRFISEVRRFLSRSGLKSSQWTFGLEPPSESDSGVAGKSATSPIGANEKRARAIVTGRLRCDLRSFQDF